MTDNRFFNRSEFIGILVLAVFLVVVLPLTLDVFRLNLVAKYLTYAFVALGLVICWGYGGILSLGQGVFFGLGGYCMAMFLKLEASSVANFKIFAYCIAAVFAAIGGAMFALNVGFMSPSFVGIVPSIEMVIYTAVGGRLSILGAIYGTLLVNFAKTSLSETFPELWLFGLGGLFIAVVLAFPNGLAGIWGDYVQPRIDRLISSRKSKPDGWTDSSVADGAPAE